MNRAPATAQEELNIQAAIMQRELFFSQLYGGYFQGDMERILREATAAPSVYQRVKDTLFYHRFLDTSRSVFVEELPLEQTIQPHFSKHIRNAENLFLSIREHKYEEA